MFQLSNTLFISAGAGSGKTHRLTHDLADLLTGKNYNGNNPDELKISPSEVIVTTFTKAAASEIKERARQELLNLRTADGIQQATQLDTAAIGTIHSVAQRFLGKYWYLLGSCPNQGVLTDEDQTIYRNQSLAKLMDTGTCTAPRAAIDLYFREFRPSRRDDNFIPTPNPAFWVDDVNKIVQRATYYEITDFTESRKESAHEVNTIFSGTDATPTIQDLADVIDTLISHIEGVITRKGLKIKPDGKRSPKEFSTQQKFRDTRAKYCRTNTDGSLELPQEYVPYHKLLSVYSELHSIIKDYNGSRTAPDLIPLHLLSRLDDLLVSPHYGSIIIACMNAVFDIAEKWMADYEDFKRKLGVIDYDDMEKGFNRLLDIPSVQDDIRNSISLVMVDEFQDCNPMQLKIFSKLSMIIAGNRDLPYNSIWVGDPNQSIYGFRGSDTNLINRVKSLFTARYPDKTADGLSHYTLTDSYRSRSELVDYAGQLFKSPYFTDFTPLHAHRAPGTQIGLDSPVQQWNFQKVSNDHLTVFARHLKKIVDDKLYKVQTTTHDAEGNEHETSRDIRFSDIAILVRNKAELNRIVPKLREEGVPASAPEASILDRAEVQLVLAMLNLRYTVEDPETGKLQTHERPHELASLLRLWCDWPTHRILRDRIAAVQGTTDWSPVHTPGIDPVRVALDNTSHLPIDERITSLILQLDLYDRVSKWGENEANVRRQNLMTLQNVARQFVDRCHRLGFQATEREFTLYLADAQIEPGRDNTSDCIRLFTYHGSKGLQWPMVILFSMDNDALNLDEQNGNTPLNKFLNWEYFGAREVQKQLTAQADEIFPGYYINYFPSPYSTTAIPPLRTPVIRRPIYLASKQRQKDESKRLFYVGLTRARDYAIYFTAPTYCRDTKSLDFDTYPVSWTTHFCWLNCIGLDSLEPSETQKPSETLQPLETLEPSETLQPVSVRSFPPLIPPKPDKASVPTKFNNGESIELQTKLKAQVTAYNDRLQQLGNEYQAAKQKEQDIQDARRQPKAITLHDLPALHDPGYTAKYLSPSKLPGASAPQQPTYTFQPLAGATHVSIPDNGHQGHGYDPKSLGSCIHNIFAACPDSLIQNQESLITDQYITVAKTIIKNYSLQQTISDQAADQLVHNLLAMFHWLEKTYGPATQIVHEYPFNYPYGPIQNSKFKIQNSHHVVRGEIDLVYCAQHTDIIIDFKNYHQDPSYLTTRTKGHEAHYVGTHYVSQLAMYRTIWQQANPGKTIKTYLYYDILGGVVEV